MCVYAQNPTNAAGNISLTPDSHQRWPSRRLGHHHQPEASRDQLCIRYAADTRYRQGERGLHTLNPAEKPPNDVVELGVSLGATLGA